MTRRGADVTENLLGRETSPYLLQHKDNPVHWRPWGPDALAEAEATGKPILLSVGYAACHWCHVMAHESFEDPTIAALMNQLYVNIKVDREERPDIDTIYQSALQMLGQQGGWPLTMFLTPSGEPFWGGTYFPPESRWGRPGFPEVLFGVSNTYKNTPQQISENVEALRDGLASLATPAVGTDISEEQANGFALRLMRAFDPVHGGLGGEPKFPQCVSLLQLWSAGGRMPMEDGAQDEPLKVHPREGVLYAVRQMCEGGIYDHLGGGFARYTVDRAWRVPHFEKMLYDNAQLLDLLSLAWGHTSDPLFRRRAEETVHWILSDMTVAEGGFASACDADSEGEEGKYYVWSEAEIDGLLAACDPQERARFKTLYDVTPDGNWEGKTILNRLALNRPLGGPDLVDLARPDDAEEARMAALRRILLAARNQRIPPLKDDKVLADWNGLMIAALARAASVFDRADWCEAAIRAFDFVSGPMANGDRLRHSFRAGRAQHAATLDDYANMMRAALALYEETGAHTYLDKAWAWFDVLETHYRDAENGAYFLTADDAEALISRTKTAGDNATPSGNGVLITVLAKLSWLVGDSRPFERASEVVRAFAGEVETNFFAYPNLLEGAQFLRAGLQIVIVGPSDAPETQALARAARKAPIVERLVLQLAPGEALPEGHVAVGKGMVDEQPAAYICDGPVCSRPVTDPEQLMVRLVAF